ncbi:hypothetical protein JOM56_004423 [Amanita muscaria]
MRPFLLYRHLKLSLLRFRSLFSFSLQHSTPVQSCFGMADGIDNTYGAALIGVIVSAMLYGITNLQTYFYYMTYPKDQGWMKTLVSVIWILDTVHMALVSMTIYHYLVTNYSNPSALAVGHWSLYVSIVVNIAIASIVQLFFTMRIFQLCSQNLRWWVALTILLLIAGHIGFGLETVVFLFIKQEFSRLAEITLIAAMPFALFAVLSDIAIATALCILLHSSRTSFSRYSSMNYLRILGSDSLHFRTNAVLSTLMMYAINRCLLTSVVAILEVVVFAAAPTSLWFLAVDFCIGTLWANSLLAALNSRKFLNDTADRSQTANTTTRISNLEFSDQSTGAFGSEPVSIILIDVLLFANELRF